MTSRSTAQWRSGAFITAEAIGQAIVEGEFSEGERLPLEAELASRFSVSRNTLREAMKLLAAKSMVAIAPRRGTVVLPRAEWNVLDPDVIDWFGALFRADPQFLEELARTRQTIEPAAAYEAARSADPEQVNAIAEAYRGMEELRGSDNAADQVTVDVAFHLAVADAGNNRFIQSIIRSIIHAVRANFEALLEQPGNFEGNLKNHRLVYEAIAAHDPDRARASMERLLEQSLSDTKELFGSARTGNRH
ncbi:FadR family transcriptional regulator [Nitratireductor aquimarinus]|uniref:FadR/GntR family transcriptional regulator n=1 Tax=Alphaproteobacteria TaxID=28211 RepID=UPI0019D3F8B5|nr:MULTISPECIES: FadR/GntR family transcriptional regulator [Alphaproteobacteria]MBN7755257.1 FadR family transcriptional regulator [Nitratireductor aquimarinus]MBY5998011.1 FadR family transcriptional regulator [Tritonibacter mobilis]MBY6020039.1 FadR family transcriptional regulator [Nitratireductor sp. DP7N14-4]MCV0380355.1 FadR family transcriptional regulator [Nitratireductor sp.]